MLSTTPLRLLLGALLFTFAASNALAEDGRELWLRYRSVETPLHAPTAIVEGSHRPTLEAAASELRRGLTGLFGGEPGDQLRGGAIVLGTPASSPLVASLHLSLKSAGDEGYCLKNTKVEGHPATVIAANSDLGVLYGAFAYLRLIQTRSLPRQLDACDAPAIPIRMLDHWANLDGTVERGYAGPSLWNWDQLPTIDPRLIDYARVNASIGINGAVLNNVNADARILTPDYLSKVAAIARAWRPYGVRVYLSARFSAPKEIGGLPTADPLDPSVRSWWRAKADEIYRLIPDFGGFLVKANAEGQPGPQIYGRTHADGANMLADALAPHHGIILWRAFVYSAAKEDRAKQAYDEFRALDGKFRPNVILQVKNGPIDFQPREPFHPLFGRMERTNVAMEVQLTREYLGQGSGIVFLAPMWSEALEADTCSPHCGTPVRATIKALAGVSNAGSDRNWTGNHFDQANWYAFGRLAWDPAAAPSKIADEWTRMTWGNDPRLVRPIVEMMTRSREAAVDTMTPLGLAHQMATDHHYGPGPWVCDLAEPSWNPCYYSHADPNGVGFDRTASGSDAVAQYAPKVGDCFGDLKCVSDANLLWFHHVGWTYRMRSGRSLWVEIVAHYDEGVASVEAAQSKWDLLRPFVDGERHAAVAETLGRHSLEAKWWRDASIAYWQSLSKLPLPKGHRPPPHPLSWYQSIHFDTVPGYLAPGTGRELSCVPPRGGPPCAL
ncbi:MAG TPA: alpha-glucuronidase family glycosyl hydrolase [Sphingomicrobium sp.]|nr:alpha-glucuronidase family glycosyl hydrolase [Sphingomicrobium sp.]